MDKTTNKNITEYTEMAKRLSKKVEELGITVDSTYIFGSRIKGTEHKWSDLDTCIVSPAFGMDNIAERVLLMGMREGISDLIEPHPMSTYEFNDKYNLFANEIKKTGIKVI